MINKKAIAIASFFLFVIILNSGCLELLGIGTCDVDEDCPAGYYCDDGSCIGGVKRNPKGIEISFLEGWPPDKIKVCSSTACTEKETFDMYVILTNLGSYAVPANQIKVTLYGGSYSLPANSINNWVWTNKAVLAGAEDYEPYGGTETLIIEGLTYEGSPVTEIPMTVGASLDYDYQTTAIGQICLKAANDEDALCSPDGNKLQSLSAGPVLVDSIYENTYGELVDLEITVTNSGRGTVCKKGSGCASRLDEDIVTLEKVMVGVTDYVEKCEKKTERLSIDEQEATFLCKGISGRVLSTKEEPVEIVIGYGYKDSIEKIIEVSQY